MRTPQDSGLDTDYYSNISLPDCQDFEPVQSTSLHSLTKPILPAAVSYHDVGIACASPGPVKKFRLTYGSEMDVQQQQQPKKPNTRHMETENWMANHHSDYPNYSSKAPSLVSNTSALSRLSAVSIDTELSVSVSTDLFNFNLPNFQNLNALQPHAATSSAASSCSFSENLDPCYLQQIDSYLLNITNKLIDSDEQEKREALHYLYLLTKKRYFSYGVDPSKVQLVLSRCLCIITTPTRTSDVVRCVLRVFYEMTYCKVCLEAIRREFQASNGVIIHILCNFLEPDEKFCILATNILHTLFNQPYGMHYRRCARHESIVKKLMRVASSPCCTYKHIALENIRIIICTSKETTLKKFFARNGGMEMCLRLMGEYGDERLLFRIVHLLNAVVNGEQNDKSLVDYFCSIQGVQLLSTYLNHGSPRLLQTIAKCLSAVSDSDELLSQIIDDALGSAVQILGSTDIELVYHITGFLANVQSKNPRGKIYLHDHKAIENLMCVLKVWSDSAAMSTAHKEKIDDILDNVLVALGNLTTNYPNLPNYPPYATTACGQIVGMTKFVATKVFLELLVSDRLCLRTRILMLLNRIIEHMHEVVASLENVHDSHHSMNYPFHIVNLVFAAAQEFVQSPKEKQMKCKLLFKRAVILLFYLTSHNIFFEQIVNLSK